MNPEDYPFEVSLPSNKGFAKVLKRCGETMRKLIILRRCRIEQLALAYDNRRPGRSNVHHRNMACDVDVIRKPRPLCQLKVGDSME